MHRYARSQHLALLLFVLVAMALQGVAQSSVVTVKHNHTTMSSAEHESNTMASSPCMQDMAHHSGVDNTAGQSDGDMSCCGGDCQCYTLHCFSSGGVALFYPIPSSFVVIARLPVSGLLSGQTSLPIFKQFRPPKSLFTA